MSRGVIARIILRLLIKLILSIDKMKKTLLTALAAVTLFNGSLMAVPAKHGLRVFDQPDGSTIELRKIGDERAHVTLSPEGYPVTLSNDGFYRFAEIGAKGKLVETSVKVRPLASLSAADRAIVERIDLSKVDMLLKERCEASPMTATQNAVVSRAGGGIGLMDNSLYGRETLKGLVVLAQYQDVKFTETCTRDFFETMLNEPGFSQFDATGSARDYFIDASSGKFTPTFDVYGPVTLPHEMAYYGGNSADGSRDKNAVRMIYDACAALDSEVDFSEYDQDGDGYVDNVFVFYAGYGEASYGSDDSVWPHQWTLASGGLTLRLDGVYVNKYACSNELVKDNLGKPKPDGIGTFVHEFSHVLGLPDLYVTTSAGGNWTPGQWNVLDQGPYNNDSRTPPTYSVYERYSLGWIEPTVIDGPESLQLNSILDSNEAFIIPTESENEFFLIENRQQNGWDKYVPGHGMLVWHIDYNQSIWKRNSVNSDERHCRVDIEEAIGKWANPNDYTSTKAYMQAIADYAFPGSKGVTSFTDATTPSMRTWSGVGLGLPITDITETDGVIAFNVAGGRCEAEVPVVTRPSVFGDNWFEASWLPSEGAVDYVLTVKGDFGAGALKTDVVDFEKDGDGNVTLPEGWSYLSGDGQFYDDHFGEAAPALKLSKTGEGIQSREFDSDIKSIEFWAKGITINAQTTLIVSGLVNDTWQELISKSPARTSEGEVITINNIPEGTRQIRITFNRKMGYIALDDLKVSYMSGGLNTLAEYRMRSVGNVTSHVVENLPEGVSKFVYTVCAVDRNGRRSAPSEEQVFDFDDKTGIDDVVVDDADAPVRYYNLQGVEIKCPTSGIVIRRQGNRSEKIVITQ